MCWAKCDARVTGHLLLLPLLPLELRQRLLPLHLLRLVPLPRLLLPLRRLRRSVLPALLLWLEPLPLLLLLLLRLLPLVLPQVRR